MPVGIFLFCTFAATFTTQDLQSFVKQYSQAAFPLIVINSFGRNKIVGGGNRAYKFFTYFCGLNLKQDDDRTTSTRTNQGSQAWTRRIVRMLTEAWEKDRAHWITIE